MIASDPSKRPVYFYQLAAATRRLPLRRTVSTIPPIGYRSLRGGLAALGDTLPDITDPDVQSWANDIATDINSWFGAGRHEADIITDIQTPLGAKLDQITAQIVIGQHPSLAILQQLYTKLKELWASFYYFVSDARFTDGRASAQALNTLGPIIDGTCGYRVHDLFPYLHNCAEWGTGTIGGSGTNGMLGAISRAIVQAGGTAPGGSGVIPLPPGDTATMGLSTPAVVAIGVLAIFMFSRGRR